MTTADVTPRPATIRSVAIVGAGLAGASAAAALRTHGFDGHVTLLGEEPVPPYDRPPLSKQLMTRPEPAWLRDELGVDVTELCDTVTLGSAASGISWGADGRAVIEHPGGSPLVADAVIVATGAHAVVPRHLGAALPLRTAADAAAIRAAVTAGQVAADGRRPSAVVIGAGWIGAELSGVIAAAGWQVTVVEAAAHPLPSLGAVGKLTTPWYGTAGVTLLLGKRVVETRGSTVVLDDSTELPADLTVVAVGSRPATAWLGAGWGRDDTGAVLVDGAGVPLRSPAPDGRARVIGDAAARVSPRFGTVPSGHWNAAMVDAAAAIADLLDPGTADGHDPAPELFSTQLGHTMVMVGTPQLDDVPTITPTGRGWVARWTRAAQGQQPVEADVTAVLAVDSPRDASAARALLRGPTTA